MKLLHSKIHDPLLRQDEINDLIQAARPLPGHLATTIKRGARAGDFATTIPGSGTDLADLRSYYPGDDTRHIDWRASARSRQPMLRTWFSELNHPFFVVIDRRAAMRFGSRRRLKVTQAARMAITLLAREARAGREVGGLVMEAPGHWLPPLAGMNRALRLTQLVSAAAPPCEPANEQSWQAVGSELLQRLDEGAELILISDFSDLELQHKSLLKNLAQHFTTRAIQISDPLEKTTTLPCPLNLRWGSKSVEIQNRNSTTFKQMVAEEKEFQEMLESLFHKSGIDRQVISTTDELNAQRSVGRIRHDTPGTGAKKGLTK